MTQSLDLSRGVLAKAALAACLLALSLLALASSASAATYEQTGVFAGSATPLTEEQIEADEEIQLGGVGALAVNRTGAGGVPKGTVYAVTRQQEEFHGGGEMGDGARVAMYVPKAGGGLELAEAWQVRRRLEPYEVCGPPGKALPNGSEPGEHAACPVRTAAGAANLGVGVDQTSGQVYVFGGFSSHEIEQDGGGYEVVVYTADAGEEVTRFGELDLEARTIAETPEKMHSGNSNSSLLAVDSATGDVYVYDEVATGLFYSRLMVFGPHEGDRSEYEYLGEVLAGEGEERKSRAPVLDDAGHLYVAGIQETGDHIEEFAPQTPASYPAPEATPLCSFHYEKGGLEAMTVDPETGEPFFYSYKRETKAHWLRRLSACDEGSGEFTETAKMAIAPERGDLYALAFDPERRAEPSRGKGVLYGGVPNTEFQSGEGEASQSSLGYIYGQPKGPAKTLTVSRGGGGAGSVTSDPIGIECGSLCSQEFEEGETLTLTATPARRLDLLRLERGMREHLRATNAK